MKSVLYTDKITSVMKDALLKTAEIIKEDIISEEVIPYDTGRMQESLRVDDSALDEGIVYLIVGGESEKVPYARRLFFHPEYNFNRTKNKNAQGEYLLPWINGAHRNKAKETYEAILGGKL